MKKKAMNQSGFIKLGKGEGARVKIGSPWDRSRGRVPQMERTKPPIRREKALDGQKSLKRTANFSRFQAELESGGEKRRRDLSACGQKSGSQCTDRSSVDHKGDQRGTLPDTGRNRNRRVMGRPARAFY